jgi:hypothetical protein
MSVLTRRQLALGLAVTGAAAGFPAPNSFAHGMIVNGQVEVGDISWASLYQDLRSIYEEYYDTTLVPGSAWDVLLQLYAEHVYRVQSLTINVNLADFNSGEESFRDLLGDDPTLPNKKKKGLVNVA